MDNITNIDIPFPEAENLQLRLAIGACRVRIEPGDGPQWVTGTYEDPSNAVPLRILQEGNTVKITQDLKWPEPLGTLSQPPTFDLKLGKGKPYTLALEGGASESAVDLGGLPLRGLTVKYGAGKQEFDFSTPNPQVMEQLTIAAGAAGIEMEHLANANFTEMTVEGGAARYELEFGGTLQRDATVRINSGMASVDIEVPAAIAAKIDAETVLGGLEVGDGFMKKEGTFWTEGALAGNTPVLTIFAQVVMGAVQLIAAS